MNKQLTDTVFYVTGKGELQTTEKNELEALLKEHPYFAPAQLLLVAKLKNENSYNIKEQTQKASLFFNNSRWFQYQLSEIKLKTENFEYKGIEAVSDSIKPIVVEPLVVENLIDEKPTDKLDVIDEAQNIIRKGEEKVENKLSYNEVFLPNFSIPTVEHVKNIFSGIDAKEPVVEEDTKIVDENLTSQDNKTIIVENIDLPTENNIINVIENEQKQVVEISEETQTEKIDLTKNLGIAAAKEEWEKPVNELKDELLPFEKEPYYTIDYFASQGIQFDFNKQPHDKLTTKMLKFTDWLKKMKGIKPENMVFEEDDELNKTIQNIAFNSNVSKEIVTETMAEVFAKQGKTEKAIQLYIKLSFLIPQKSSYFATKIQELKGI